MRTKYRLNPMDIESTSLRPAGPDARDDVPVVQDEALKAIQDQIRGARPSTVLGLLLDRGRPMEVFTIAGIIKTPPPELDWTLEVLAQEGYVRTYNNDGLRMVALTDRWAEAD
jgi:hypothetical protein